MKIWSVALLLAGTVALAAPADAAVLSFDLSGLEDTFQFVGPVTGGFTFDTDNAAFSDVGFATDVQGYAGAMGSVFDGSGFGLPATTFLFETGARSFLFGLEDLALAIGEIRVFAQIFAFEAEKLTADFQVDFDGDFTFFAGDVRVTREADPVAAVPLPASLPLMLAGLAGLAALARRHRRA